MIRANKQYGFIFLAILITLLTRLFITSMSTPNHFPQLRAYHRFSM